MVVLLFKGEIFTDDYFFWGDCFFNRLMLLLMSSYAFSYKLSLAPKVDYFLMILFTGDLVSV